MPNEVKDKFSLSQDNFDSTNFTLKILITDPKSKTLLNRVYCNNYCQQNIVPKLLEKYKDFFVTDRAINLEDHIDNWDSWNAKADYSDVVGCFILLRSDVHAGPNDHRFIIRSCEHPSTCHPGTTGNVKKKTKKEGGNTAVLKQVQLTKIVSQKRKADESGQSTLTLKHQNKMQFVDVGKRLQWKVVLSQRTTNSTEEFAEGYCLAVVQGVNKCLSQEAFLNMYQIGLKGMQWWHGFVMDSEVVC